MDEQLLKRMEDFKELGAPADQSVVINLLKEIQAGFGGGIPRWVIADLAAFYGIKESFFLAIIKLIPSLRLSNSHCLEICCGPNCSKSGELRRSVSMKYGKGTEKLAIRYTGCMHMCNKGPNIRWDGHAYHHADAALIEKLIDS